tara:strand:+ start:5383 stop:5865 length:483 start_codon:yes stop_codon:yes gene_type:complete
MTNIIDEFTVAVRTGIQAVVAEKIAATEQAHREERERQGSLERERRELALTRKRKAALEWAKNELPTVLKARLPVPLVVQSGIVHFTLEASTHPLKRSDWPPHLKLEPVVEALNLIPGIKVLVADARNESGRDASESCKSYVIRCSLDLRRLGLRDEVAF